MQKFSSSTLIVLIRNLLTFFFLTLRLSAAAQAPAWQSARAVATATAAATSNFSAVEATAVDAAGNVYLAGDFSNSVVLGGTTLISSGSNDMFVAKFSSVSNQFVWAQRAGGTGNDAATALVVSGTSVYVAGYFVSSTADFGLTTLTSAGSFDVFVTKLTDAGNTSSFAWAQRAGGTGYDQATALAVNSTNVYVSGSFASSAAGFGPAILTNTGSFDVFVAKLADAGSTGRFVWAQRAGGTAYDFASALAVSGTSVYMAGSFASSTAGFGAATLNTTGGSDVFVAKLADAGSTGSFSWAQRAGGTGSDDATALVVSGTSVYVAGSFASSAANFGSTALINAGFGDVFVAKLADVGSTSSFVWAQRAGGMDNEQSRALAVSGTSVYVAGFFASPTAAFGLVNLTNSRTGFADVFVAKLTDAGNMGSFVWAQRAGDAGNEQVLALAVSGNTVYAVGNFFGPTASFSATTLTNPDANASVGFLASLTDPTLTATAASRVLTPAQLFPNPAQRTTTLRLPIGTPRAPLVLTDALGQAVRRYPAPAGPEIVLDLNGLPSGLYLLRGVGPAQRLTVE